MLNHLGKYREPNFILLFSLTCVKSILSKSSSSFDIIIASFKIPFSLLLQYVVSALLILNDERVAILSISLSLSSLFLFLFIMYYIISYLDILYPIYSLLRNFVLTAYVHLTLVVADEISSPVLPLV